MKHHLRKEKNCLNCGATVTGRFCSDCGQENLDTKENLGHLLGHFFADMTHYDSKVLITLKYLLFKPGFLSREYFAGRRTKYLNPVRLYIFISFLFFLVLFLKKPGDEVSTADYTSQSINAAKQYVADSLHKAVNQHTNKTYYDSVKNSVLNQIAAQLDTPVSTKDKEETIAFAIGGEGIKFTLQEEKYNTVKEYDSVQKILPADKKDKGFLRWIIRTNVGLKSRYGSRSNVIVGENFEHSVPKLMFIILPLFAWFIYIFHNRKKFHYTQHAIFSIHIHSFIFLIFLITSLFNWALAATKVGDILVLLSILIAFIYFVAALKKTYTQSVWLALFKGFCISIMYIISLVAGLFILAFISFMTA